MEQELAEQRAIESAKLAEEAKRLADVHFFSPIDYVLAALVSTLWYFNVFMLYLDWDTERLCGTRLYISPLVGVFVVWLMHKCKISGRATMLIVLAALVGGCIVFIVRPGWHHPHL